MRWCPSLEQIGGGLSATGSGFRSANLVDRQRGKRSMPAGASVGTLTPSTGPNRRLRRNVHSRCTRVNAAAQQYDRPRSRLPDLIHTDHYLTLVSSDRILVRKQAWHLTASAGRRRASMPTCGFDSMALSSALVNGFRPCLAKRAGFERLPATSLGRTAIGPLAASPAEL